MKIEVVALDRTLVKVYPDGTGALKNPASNPLASPAVEGRSRLIWLPRMLKRLFRRLKGFRRIFSRFETPNIMFVACINFAFVEGLR